MFFNFSKEHLGWKTSYLYEFLTRKTGNAGISRLCRTDCMNNNKRWQTLLDLASVRKQDPVISLKYHQTFFTYSVMSY